MAQLCPSFALACFLLFQNENIFQLFVREITQGITIFWKI
jgi:hypothetical protein